VVSTALSSWYRQKYFLAAVLGSTLIISSLLFFIEYGYIHDGNRLIYLSGIGFLGAMNHQQELEQSAQEFQLKGYSFIDATAILTASIDKGLNGYYLKITSYVLAENIEVLAFLLVLRKVGSKFL